MNFKKWLTVFLITCFAVCVLFAAYNALVDPFGIFGDRLLRYPEYSMTQNPRIAKIAYLDKNHEKYDSYVIGCSKSSSLPTEALNRYFNASFYNMIMYGGDLYDIEKTAEYIIENYTAKNIVVVIGLEEARAFNTEADGTKGNLHAKVDGSSIFPFYPGVSSEKHCNRKIFMLQYWKCPTARRDQTLWNMKKTSPKHRNRNRRPSIT